MWLLGCNIVAYNCRLLGFLLLVCYMWLLRYSVVVATISGLLGYNMVSILHRKLIVVVARWHSTRGIVPVHA